MNAQVEKYFTPIEELNALTVDYVTKLVNLQIKRLEENTKIGVDQLKATEAVKDTDGFKTYLDNCAAAMRQISESAVEDIRTAFDLGTTYTNEAQRIFKDALKIN